MRESGVLSLPKAAGLALLAALAAVAFGGAALWLGWAEQSLGLMGFGAVALLQVPLAFSLRGRIREGFGNRGLDREHRTLRLIVHAQRLAALGLALGSAAALMARRSPDGSMASLGLALGALGAFVLLWLGKRALADGHPALGLDAARARLPLEAALLLLAGTLALRGLPAADAAAALLMALRLFQTGHALAKATSLQAACGGGCGGCGCG